MFSQTTQSGGGGVVSGRKFSSGLPGGHGEAVKGIRNALGDKSGARGGRAVGGGMQNIVFTFPARWVGCKSDMIILPPLSRFRSSKLRSVVRMALRSGGGSALPRLGDAVVVGRT